MVAAARTNPSAAAGAMNKGRIICLNSEESI
jgi:hypothetical protein